MQDQDGLNPDERELESAMKSLSPAAARIDPVAAAFAAGLRSGRRPLHLWRAAAVLMLLVGAVSWLAPIRHSVVVEPHEFTEPAIVLRPPPAAESLQVLQQTVLEKGLDGLPAENIPAIRVLHAEDIF